MVRGATSAETPFRKETDDDVGPMRLRVRAEGSPSISGGRPGLPRVHRGTPSLPRQPGTPDSRTARCSRTRPNSSKCCGGSTGWASSARLSTSPDLGGQLTAFATEPLSGDSRRIFWRYPLLTLGSTESCSFSAVACLTSPSHASLKGRDIAAANAPEVHKSRWGFHPCTWKTFWKLKLIHKWYWQTAHAYANWKRWQRKLPQNRIIRRWIRDTSGRRIGYEVVGPRPEPAYCPAFVDQGGLTDQGFLADYQNARMPQTSPETVSPLSHAPEMIERMYLRVKTWFETNG